MTATLLPPVQAPNAGDDVRRPRRDWYPFALGGLLLATAVLYLWGLSESGWGNSFYAAAAQAGSESWKAFFFGSSDAANSITVDKTPLSLWPMALSVRIFGLSSWSILVPQAIEGVLAVWLLVSTVRRTTRSSAAGLIAGAALAVTPVAVLMFRFDNPDAMLVLLMVGAAYAVLRAIEAPLDLGAVRHPVRWMALAGVLVGLGFLTKMLQVFLVLPAFALVYLVAANTGVLKRLGHLLVAFGSMIAAAGWWIAIVELWPASSRPYIGGSQDNSILELTLGYNGFGRLNGNETGSVGGGGGGTGSGMWGETGITRLFSSEVGGQIAWLLPTALLMLVAGFWLAGRAPRTDRVRAALILWGGWLLVTGLTFSFMAGIFHAYYTVALAPAVAALVGIGAWQLWQHRGTPVGACLATAAVLTATVTSFVLLTETPDFVPWLRWTVLVLGLLAAIAVAGLGWMPRRIAAVVAAVAVAVSLAGSASYAVETAGTAHTGSIPTAGPSSSGGFGGGPGGGGGGMPGGGGGMTQGGSTTGGTQTGGAPTGGGMSGLLDSSSPGAELVEALQADAGDYTWVAAAVGSNSAAGYQLATEEPVMAIGGFNGSDPSPTLEEFEQYVANGEIHYFIGGSGFGQSQGGSSASSDIAAWVADNFTATTIDGVTVYDLSGGADQ
ncbi:ArnT family glycosyltransferase [Nocardioides mangrovi]|uniref:Glycosyltransferase family 39 protein n=1 Tax=Nocardioides mangrovi TaxID=2874580 RepID=A0ABS7UBQ0_9ACTN|nr:glycosyltransferase family 39 protein [Nocardioides mangrovi]MBZ5738156.1 glycosyltransferase family 39 protein [Nocardioides mangrovi]